MSSLRKAKSAGRRPCVQ